MEDQVSKTISFLKKHGFVILVLSVSALLRWMLIFRGGQFFFPDESRYGIAQDTAALLLDGKLRAALFTLTSEIAHLGFKAMALVPALIQNAFHTTTVLPAIFFSLFSILNLFLIWKIAQKTGGEQVASYAILLAACSQVLLFYSRHFLPYDQAMFFGLLTLYIALHEPANPKLSLLCGAIGFLCLITYNGYWAIAGLGMLVHLFHGMKERGWFWKRSIFLGLGFLIPLALMLGIFLFLRNDFLSNYGIFLQKITQGDFSEGWTLPFAYFWHAEHGLILGLGLLAIIALIHLRRQGNATSYLGLAGILFIYLCLVISSNLTHTFVVYGRLARQMMPFLILLAASGLGFVTSWKPGKQWLVNFLLFILIVQSLWNYRSSYVLVFPREFVTEVQAEYPEFKISSKMMQFYSPPVCHNNAFLAANVHYLYDWSQPVPSLEGKALRKALHPVNFLPYQYEGYSPEQRQDLRRQNFEMVFYRLDNEDLSNVTRTIENCYQEK